MRESRFRTAGRQVKMSLYRSYAEAMREKYGEKVYKLPVNIPVSCPNRDGSLGTGGCTFCGEAGTGFENLSDTLSVSEQLVKNMEYIGKRYGASKFTAYFQNFSNTYLPLESFRQYMEEAASIEGIVEICVSTRPDCISDRYLSVLSGLTQTSGKHVSIELGLQSTDPHTLQKINRGHGLAEFIDAVMRIHRFDFDVCAHVILDLPWDDDTDAVETARILTALRVEQVKLHSLYIEKGTEMARQYENGEFTIISPEEYAERAVMFLENISPDMIVQRLVSRAPEENTVFCNWGMSWWRIRDMITERLESRGSAQGSRCDYLNRDYYSINK